MALSNSSFIASLTTTQTKTTGNVALAQLVQIAQQINLDAGTAANQVDLLYQDLRSLNATTENLDLAGSLTDLYGSTLTFVKVRGIIVVNTNTTPGAVLTLGGAASNAWSTMFGAATHTLKVDPGGMFLNVSPISGFAVTAATGDLLKVDAGSANITYRIGILGTSA